MCVCGGGVKAHSPDDLVALSPSFRSPTRDDPFRNGILSKAILSPGLELFRRLANARVHPAHTLKDKHRSEQVRFREEVEARHEPGRMAAFR